MPEETIIIGGKSFEVACQPGEEHFLQAAARMLDTEARTLLDQIGRVPESRMLLMSGLMLADKAAGLEDRALRAEEELKAVRDEVARLRAALRERSEMPAPPAGPLPAQVIALSELASRAEALARQLDEKG
jgi:cell division protein ZapA